MSGESVTSAQASGAAPSSKGKPHYYDGYDYVAFWDGREYEHASDMLAVKRLLARAPGGHDRIIDVGAGGGRISSLYLPTFKECVILEPSASQLDLARERFAQFPQARFVQAFAEDMPFAKESVDVIVCIRVFHYVADPDKVLREFKRVIKPGGHLILEIPSKIHFKMRLRALFDSAARKTVHSREPVNISTTNNTFLNHHPDAIAKALTEAGFTIQTTLSVSNFRGTSLKRFVPRSLLMGAEYALQRIFAPVRFGPSMYYLARRQ